MKRTISLFLLLLLACKGFSQKDKAIALTPSVQKATVYPNGAYLECTASKFLAGGKQVIKFTGLPADILPSSIRISSSQGATVHSVSAEKNYLRPAQTSEEIRQLKDSLHTYQFDYRFNQNMLEVYAEERNMILANKEVGWEKGGFVAEDLEDLSDFYRDRLADIMLKSMQVEAKQKKVERNLKRVEAQFDAIETISQATSDVHVDVTVPGNGSHSFEISFFTASAGWEPVYHIQPKNNGSVLDVWMNAQVFQKSGMDWAMVEMHFSGNSPLIEGNITSSTAGVFSAKEKTNLASNGVLRIIQLENFDVPIRTVYEIVPEASVPVVRVALASGNQENLLPGKAVIFQDGFSGSAEIERDAATGDFRIPLATDGEIRVDKKLQKQTVKSGKTRKESSEFEISVRNTKKGPVTIVLKDAIRGQKGGTTFKLDDAKDAVFDPDGCTLTWNKTIDAGATVKVSYKYTLIYPIEHTSNEKNSKVR